MTAYPTRRAVALMAAGAAPALIVALAAPRAWVLAAGWVLLTTALIVADLVLSPSPRDLEVDVGAPGVVGVGRTEPLRLLATFRTGAPRELEIADGGDERLQVRPERQRLLLTGRGTSATFSLHPLRRGLARLSGPWLRWRGPLGLVWRQTQREPPEPIAVTPDVQSVREQALQLFSRDAPFGRKAELDPGEGAEFHALKEFQTGMDKRTVDWKQSARHGKLLAREFRVERNHHVVLALDCGRLMSAPVAGAARIDRAINAALLLAFTSLKLGDRVGLFAFDSRPRVASGVAAGAGAFALLQRLATSIDYSTEETNFTLGLTQLSGQLKRRTLITIFTDFADATSAELMLENVGRLTKTHLVLFVVFRDTELESLILAEPETADDVSRSVIAQTIARQREGVLARLRRMGVQIVDAPADALGPALINAYVEIKRRELV